MFLPQGSHTAWALDRHSHLYSSALHPFRWRTHIFYLLALPYNQRPHFSGPVPGPLLPGSLTPCCPRASARRALPASRRPRIGPRAGCAGTSRLRSSCSQLSVCFRPGPGPREGSRE